MNECLKLKKSNCKNCYKCIRHCPVKSIRFSSGQAHIIEDECILCGHCFVHCPQNAKEIRNDIDIAKQFIAEGNKVYASIAPSFVANYDGKTISSIKKALLQLGFYDVEETAVGATIVKKAYEDMISSGENDIIISSCCPTVNMLIQKYYPEALKYLAQVMSPMQVHCSKIKKEHKNAKTIFIGPCISKKAEASQYPGIVDCVLTFEELSQWFAMEGVKLEDIKDTDENKGKTRLFPTNGGVLKSMDCSNPDYGYISIDGIENCISALKDILNGKISKCFIEMSSCSGSCVGGPIMERTHLYPVRDYLWVKDYAGDEDFRVKMPSSKDLLKEMKPIDVVGSAPDSIAINEILHRMGKTKPEHELNCGTCGYNTCREKAAAVLRGKADLSMCLPYLKEKAESFSEKIISSTPNGVIVTNEDLKIQQINKSACQITNIKDEHDVLGEHIVRILDPTIFFDVLQGGKDIRDKMVYLSEYKKYIEQTVVHDKSYNLLLCLMRDVTEREKERQKKDELSKHTMEIADKVIEKQMRVVQEIALLLGETTAETKIAMTNLKESLEDE